MDKAAFVCRRAESLAKVAENGLTPNLHRAIKPLKMGFKAPRLLLKNHEGAQTVSREAEAEAIKSVLAIRGRGSMMSYADIVNQSRTRKRDMWYGPLSSQAVVGVVDTRRRAAATNPAKSHGPGNAAPAIFFAFEGEATVVRPLNRCQVSTQITPANEDILAAVHRVNCHLRCFPLLPATPSS